MPASKQVLVLQHAEPEHLGLISEALKRAQVAVTCVRPDLGQPVPANLDGFQGLIVLGGPQSVYEEERFPYLRAEKALTGLALAANCPVLGVCLGSQILAEVLGSRVSAGRDFELGWREVTLSSAALSDPVLAHLPRVITPLHWHGDVYDLPAEAKPIGASALTPVQGFVWKQRCYAFLFHLETTPEQVAAMADTFPNDVLRGGTTPAALLVETANRAATLRAAALEVFGRWADLL